MSYNLRLGEQSSMYFIWVYNRKAKARCEFGPYKTWRAARRHISEILKWGESATIEKIKA